jgi:hypothetical protein
MIDYTVASVREFVTDRQRARRRGARRRRSHVERENI